MFERIIQTWSYKWRYCQLWWRVSRYLCVSILYKFKMMVFMFPQMLTVVIQSVRKGLKHPHHPDECCYTCGRKLFYNNKNLRFHSLLFSFFFLHRPKLRHFFHILQLVCTMKQPSWLELNIWICVTWIIRQIKLVSICVEWFVDSFMIKQACACQHSCTS